MTSTSPPRKRTREYTKSDDNAKRLSTLYVSLGWSILPIRNRTKVPAESRWKDRQSSRASLADVNAWIDSGHGLGVVLGDVSDRWVCRDFDKADAYHAWATEYPDAAGSLPTARTARGYHVFIRSDCPIKSSKFADGEMRSDGNYVLLAPSIRPDGVAYRWITEPSEQTPVSVAGTGLNREWFGGVDTPTGALPSVTEKTEWPSVVSVLSVTVDEVAPEQHEQAMEAIDETVPIGVGRRNDGIFQFARKLVGIMDGQPSDEIIRKYAMLWYGVAKPTIGTLDPGVTIADLHRAVRRVAKPDGGEPLLDRLMRKAMALDKPSFVADFDDKSSSVRLAKLVCMLSQDSDDGVFYLGCRDAAKHAGYASHTQANRVLSYWARAGILEVVKRGKQGAPGSPATRYRLVANS